MSYLYVISSWLKTDPRGSFLVSVQQTKQASAAACPLARNMGLAMRVGLSCAFYQGLRGLNGEVQVLSKTISSRVFTGIFRSEEDLAH